MVLPQNAANNLVEPEPTPIQERCVHLSLLIGLVMSGALLLAGLLVALATGESSPGGLPPGFSVLLRRAVSADGIGLIQLGLLILMATPLLRVLVLSVVWLLDPTTRRFALVAVTVMALLAVSLALGLG